VLALQTASVAEGTGAVAGEWRREVLTGKKREMGRQVGVRYVGSREPHPAGRAGDLERAGVGAGRGRFDQGHLRRVTFMGPATRQGRLSHVRRRPGDRINLSFDLESP
jgi:hypothetical protein